MCLTGWYFLAIDLENIATIMPKRYFVSFLIALKNSCRQAILTRKILSPKSKTIFFQGNRQWRADIVVCLLHLRDCLLFVVGGVETKIKNKSHFKALYFEKGNDQFLSQSSFFRVFYERTNDHRLLYKNNYYRREVYTRIA